jgi:hypothetical protein
MQRDDPNRFHRELVQLIEQQIATLARESCERLTDKELREYHDRKKRIDELYDSLEQPDSAA